MRILLYSDTPDANGAGQINHMIACGLQRSGLEVCVAQARADHTLIRGQTELGIQHYWLHPDNIYADPVTARAFTDFHEPQRIFAAVSPDLVFFADGAPVSNLAAKQVAAAQAIPFICLVHLADERTLERYRAHLPALTTLYKAARQVVAVSQNNLDLLRGRAGLREDKGQVILNARPDEFFAPRDDAARQSVRSRLGLEADALICLTSARVELEKGCHYLLEAARLLRASPHWPRLHFVWAGDGTRLQQMHSLARLLQVDEHLHFLGRRNDVRELLSTADIFILPSQAEGMPLAVIEAMAQGLPIMATAVGGTPEALGDCGLLLPNPTTDKPVLIKTMASYIDHWVGDAALRQRLGLAAHDRAARLFREGRMVEEYLALVQRQGG